MTHFGDGYLPYGHTTTVFSIECCSLSHICSMHFQCLATGTCESKDVIAQAKTTREETFKGCSIVCCTITAVSSFAHKASEVTVCFVCLKSVCFHPFFLVFSFINYWHDESEIVFHTDTNTPTYFCSIISLDNPVLTDCECEREEAETIQI